MNLEQIHEFVSIDLDETCRAREVLEGFPLIEPELCQTPLVRLYLFLARTRLFVVQRAGFLEGGDDHILKPAIPDVELAPDLDAWHRKFFRRASRVAFDSFREAHLVSHCRGLSEHLMGASIYIQIYPSEHFHSNLMRRVKDFSEVLSDREGEMNDLATKLHIPNSALREPVAVMYPCVEPLAEMLDIHMEEIEIMRLFLEENNITVTTKIDGETVDPISELAQLRETIYETVGGAMLIGKPIGPKS